MEQANRQPKQNRTAHTKRTAGSGSADQTNRRKSLRKGGRKAARRSGTKRRNTAEKGKIPPWASREKAAKNLCPLRTADKRQADPGGSAGRAQKRQAACGPENNAAEGGHDCSKPHARPPGLRQGTHAGTTITQAAATAAGRARTASPAHGAARRTKRTPPNRQNSRSLFCLPGGAM